MALIKTGSVVGEISGRVGGIVYSHNAGGMYIRNGSIPINPSTSYRDSVKAMFSAASKHWTTLSEANRKAWSEWASTIAWKNRLGASISLSGQMACIQCNSRILAVGGTMISVPALTDSPSTISGVTLTADIGAGTFNLAWTSGALAAGCKLYLRGCTLPSDSQNYTKNRWRTFMISAAATTSPQTLKTAFETRFGTLTAGERVGVEYSVIDSASGLVSSVASILAEVTDTP